MLRILCYLATLAALSAQAVSVQAEMYICTFSLSTGLAESTTYRRINETTFSLPQYGKSYTKTVFKETERGIWFFEPTDRPTDRQGQGPGFSVTVIDKETGRYYNDRQDVREPDTYADIGRCEILAE